MNLASRRILPGFLLILLLDFAGNLGFTQLRMGDVNFRFLSIIFLNFGVLQISQFYFISGLFKYVKLGKFNSLLSIDSIGIAVMLT